MTIPAPAAYDTVHVAAPDHIEALTDELAHRGSKVVARHEDLIFASGACGPAAWAANTWLTPTEYPIESIGAAARRLRALQRNWALHAVGDHRRCRLIAERLPTIRFRALSFPCTPPTAALGAWCLLDRHRLLASPTCSSPFADGVAVFEPDRDGPPNRAYLKLWEALTLARCRPGPGDHCLDLGASPGGWTWVLAGLGARVTAVDRAGLAPALAANPHITQRRGDAFALRAEDIGPVKWICSDLIAYPERLLALARYWASACPTAHIVLTVKCQGTVDAALIARFLEIPGAGLCHLSANKHELTFFRLPGGPPPEAVTAAG